MEVQYDIEPQPTILFDENEIPLTKKEWQELSTLLVNSEYEHIIGGDANESHSVRVSRYYNDVGLPEALNDFSAAAADIVMSPKCAIFISSSLAQKSCVCDAVRQTI